MDPIPDEAEGARALASILAEVTGCVALTGAGASAASGVPTYRGAGGSWSRYDPQKYASIDYFRKDPTYYWNFFRDERYPALSRAEPNPVHFALASMESSGLLTALVTQNIDGLHQAAGSRRVLELHGNSRRFLCESCGAVHEANQVRELIDTAIPPACPQCSEPRLRPDVVLFGEQLPGEVLSESFRLMSQTPLAMVVGSSLVVQPAAALPVQAIQNGARLVILNVDPTPLDGYADLVVRAPADKVLPRVI